LKTEPRSIEPVSSPEPSGRRQGFLKSQRIRPLRVLGVSFVIASLSGLAWTYWWLSALGIFEIDKNRISALQNYRYKDNSIVLDSEQQKIGEFFDRYHVFVPYEELPKSFINSLIAVEDAKFFAHKGIDHKAIVRAIVARLRSKPSKQGASTITQQLVRNTLLHREKTIERKIQEIAWALEVEKQLTKEKILELYVNIMFLGNGSYGVGAAAHRYFGKEMRHITPAEGALLAGLFQSPSRYNPAKFPDRAKQRQKQVIAAMKRQKMISSSEATAMAEAKLTYREYKYINTQAASWFVDYISDSLKKLRLENPHINKMSGLRIHTTLNSKLQSLAEKTISWYDARLDDLANRTGKVKVLGTSEFKHAAIEASMLVTDPNTGDILAMVGGRNYKRSQFNRTTSAMRSPGSAFKPVVYAEALRRGYKWSDVIYVSPVNIENYRPKNMEDDYLTETTMMRAFYRSMNSPTIEIASEIGLPAIIDRARQLGIRSPIKQEFGSALGSSDVTMMDIARLYGSFANQGILTELAPITKITTADGEVLWERPILEKRQRRAISEQIAYLMTQGMRAVLTSGTGFTSADLASVAAGKTGTSNDSSDNWFCGYTPNMVSTVWVGTDEHAPIHAKASGSALALPIWDQFIRNSYPVRPPTKFNRPEGIAEARIHPLYGHKVSNGGAAMFFLQNNQPIETSSALEAIDRTSEGTYRNVFRH
jgi:penicillin-binding protein 1A